MTRDELAASVALLAARDVLPPRRVDDDGVPEGGCELLGAYPLCAHGADDVGPGPWAAVVELSDGSVVGAPLVGNGSSPAGVRRALPGDGASVALVTRLSGPTAALTSLELGAFSLPAVEADPPLAGIATERAFEVDQTHDSVVVAGAVVVKWGVHLDRQAGDPPAVRLLRQLGAAGFALMPRPLGELVWRDLRGAASGGLPKLALIASATEYLPGATDGWEWYVDDLLDHVGGRTAFEAALAPATALGALVAGFHTALATRTSWEDHPVGRSTPVDATHWRADALSRLDEALSVTAGAPGERLRVLAPEARAAIEHLTEIDGTAVTLVHGDLHVGQVLRWSGGYALNDFDGNPVLSPEQRRAQQPPARDVVGMLQSLDHVGRIASRRTGHQQVAEIERWIAGARSAFLAAYRGGLEAAAMPELLDDRLLLPFAVEQECREYVYAARHLPQWVHVPDRALPALLREEH